MVLLYGGQGQEDLSREVSVILASLAYTFVLTISAITTNKSYFSMIEQIIKGEKPRNLWERVPLLPEFFGWMLIKSLSPESTYRIIVVHEKRHFHQAESVPNAEGFPITKPVSG